MRLFCWKARRHGTSDVPSGTVEDVVPFQPPCMHGVHVQSFSRSFASLEMHGAGVGLLEAATWSATLTNWGRCFVRSRWEEDASTIRSMAMDVRLLIAIGPLFPVHGFV